jgi:H+/Cl- antiporter ClcA
VDLRDEQPGERELGGRTYLVADVEPLDVDGIRTVLVGSIAWLVAFVALLPFYGELADEGRTWWLWTCLAGFGLGLFGYEYCRRRRRTRVERDEEP